MLCIIWGSSFILIKLGLNQLSPYQVAAIRLASDGLVLLPVTIRHYKKIPKDKLFIIFLSGTLGNLIPAFLFCIAESRIDSALAGALNALTPLCAIIIGAVVFHNKFQKSKIIGIAIALAGSLLLLFSKGFILGKNELYCLLVVAATICYGFNVNMVYR